MRKVRLNSGIVHDNARQLLDDTHYLGNCVKAIEMFVAAPGPDVDNAVKKTLIELQRQLDNVMGYMGMLKVNSAKLPVGSETASDDTTFLEAADSVLGLADGESIDISKAQLLYNEDTLELMLTDEEDVPEGFDVVGTFVETEDTKEDTEKDTEKDTKDDAEEAAGEEQEEPEEPAAATEGVENTRNAEEPAEGATPAAKGESEGGTF